MIGTAGSRAASDARSVTCEAGGGVMCTGAPKCDSFMVMSIDDCATGSFIGSECNFEDDLVVASVTCGI